MAGQWIWIGFEEKDDLGLRLNLPSRLAKKLESCEPLHTQERKVRVGQALRGLAFVRPSVAFQNLCTPGWHEEAHFLREECLKHRLDCFAVQVVKAVCVPAWEACPVIATQKRLEHRWNNIRSTGVKVIPKLSAGFAAIEELTLLQPGGELLAADASLGELSVLPGDRRGRGQQYLPLAEATGIADLDGFKSLPCLFLPPSIGALVLQGCWSQLVLLADWVERLPALSHQETIHVCLNRANQCSQERQQRALSKADVEVCVQQMRKAAGLLSQVQSEDDAAGFQLAASQCISALLGKQLKKVHALPDSFINQVLSGLDLRNRAMLRKHALKFVRCFPEHMRPSMEAWIKTQFVSRSQLSRGQLYLDMSMLLLQRRRLLAIKPFLKYAWGDST